MCKTNVEERFCSLVHYLLNIANTPNTANGQYVAHVREMTWVNTDMKAYDFMKKIYETVLSEEWRAARIVYDNYTRWCATHHYSYEHLCVKKDYIIEKKCNIHGMSC